MVSTAIDTGSTGEGGARSSLRSRPTREVGGARVAPSSWVIGPVVHQSRCQTHSPGRRVLMRRMTKAHRSTSQKGHGGAPTHQSV